MEDIQWLPFPVARPGSDPEAGHPPHRLETAVMPDINSHNYEGHARYDKVEGQTCGNGP
jgi:hypothetical protein